MVTNTYLPVRNGVTVSLAGWIDGLRELGHTVDVWTIAAQDPELEGVFAVRGIGSMAAGFPYPVSLAPPAKVAERSYDVVHIHHPVVLGPPAVRFARKIDAVVAATAHSDYLGYLDDYLPGPLGSRLLAPGAGMMGRFFNSCDVVFTPSTAIGHALTRWGSNTPTVASVYPVDAEALEPLTRGQARAALGISPEVGLAVYAGRIAAEKGIDTLVAEFEAARDVAPGSQLAVIGDGPRRERLIRFAAELGLADHVIFPGALSASELGRWYSAADVHVSASPAEVGPLTVIEAAACCTATVAYRVSGFEDRVVDGETGLLVTREAGTLAAAMGCVLADRALSDRLGRAAREAAANNVPRAAAGSLEAGYTRAGA